MICDVCEEPDGHRGCMLLKCSECDLYVHESCYGLMRGARRKRGDSFPEWKCWACEMKDDEPDGRRPSICILCNVKDGIHAMHPVYNKEGPEGRPLKRRNGPAWVHTLCFLCIESSWQSSGCVYSCDAEGDTMDDDNHSSSSSEDESLGPASDSDDEPSSLAPKIVETHHCVFAGKKKWPEYHAVASELRKLRCQICRTSDKTAGVLRIPLQCCAGDENEDGTFVPSVKLETGCAWGLLRLFPSWDRWGGARLSAVL
eukprot:CAMPEP_0194347318 /NCGR_PEP_ID=MMETSP0171-20130528/105919_1 /TAXON_ID=218684 /ORGANISM="Corethron pennatum, Strain L29A3" /LENGTH=256 /DNA_ID=CAMNT_0039114553 /DNA_START=41 /DNA_END=811 /DNA_ORIENTATION=-